MKNKLNTLSRAIKKGDLFYKIFCYILIKLGFSNDRLQSLEIRQKKAIKIQKKYKRILDSIDYDECLEVYENNKTIWVCWLQGFDCAPNLVKKCVKSIKKYCENVILLDETNIFEYITLPEYIVEKYKRGTISGAHYSDIVRTCILIEHGGLWIDSTTLLTSSIPNFVYSKDLFLYKFYINYDETIKYNNWFIYSKKNNRLLKIVRDLLFEFWKKENKASEYFIWHIFFSMALDKYPEDNKILNISDLNCHMLQENMQNEYDEEYWNIITSLTSIHKLTYKYDFVNENSFLDFILNKK